METKTVEEIHAIVEARFEEIVAMLAERP